MQPGQATPALKKLEDWPRGDKVALARRAVELVVGRLRMLAQWAGPGDSPLQRLFEDMALEEERHLGKFGRPGPEAQEGDAILRNYFPSLQRKGGEKGIDREIGTYLAECLWEESARFFHVLAEQASDEESRTLFRHSCESEESRLNFLRTVLL